MSKLPYRAEIDGLRAVAVLAAVLYHAGVPGAGGGFVGVDVFFVISGFLITSILTADIDGGSFSIAAFYERRIRRILPALAVVIIACSAASFFLLVPDHHEAFGRSVLATALFSSNVLFWREAGYFSAAAETKPLLHTWSLAVEEQFYIVFPLCLAALHRWAPRRVGRILAVAAGVSLTASIVGTDRAPSAAFYLAPTRAWELLVGSWLALGGFPPLRTSWQRNAVALLGAALLLWSITTFSNATAFPGFNAVIPCLGAALLIGTGGRTVVGRVLTSAPLVAIGLISYSLYLWHWPLIVFATRVRPDITPPEMAAVLAMAVALAACSWKFVEVPFRAGGTRTIPRGMVFVAATLTLAVVASTGAWAWLSGTGGRPARSSALYAQYQAMVADRVDDGCRTLHAAQWSGHACALGDSSATPALLLWGDSHAGAFSAAVDLIGKELGMGGRLASYAACPPLLGATVLRSGAAQDCLAQNDTVFASVRSGMTVVLAARWPYYLARSPITNEPPLFITDSMSTDASDAGSEQVLARGLLRTVRAIAARGARVVLVAALPEFHSDVPLMELYDAGSSRVARALVDEHVAGADAILRRVAAGTGAIVIDPKALLCDRYWCYGTNRAGVLFSDDDHLSNTGARYLAGLLRSVMPGKGHGRVSVVLEEMR